MSSVAGGGHHAVVSITFNKLSKDRATLPVRQPRGRGDVRPPADAGRDERGKKERRPAAAAQLHPSPPTPLLHQGLCEGGGGGGGG